MKTDKEIIEEAVLEMNKKFGTGRPKNFIEINRRNEFLNSRIIKKARAQGYAQGVESEREQTVKDVKNWFVGFLSMYFGTDQESTKVFIDDVMEDFERYFVKQAGVSLEQAEKSNASVSAGSSPAAGMKKEVEKDG